MARRASVLGPAAGACRSCPLHPGATGRSRRSATSRRSAVRLDRARRFALGHESGVPHREGQGHSDLRIHRATSSRFFRSGRAIPTPTSRALLILQSCWHLFRSFAAPTVCGHSRSTSRRKSTQLCARSSLTRCWGVLQFSMRTRQLDPSLRSLSGEASRLVAERRAAWEGLVFAHDCAIAIGAGERVGSEEILAWVDSLMDEVVRLMDAATAITRDSVGHASRLRSSTPCVRSEGCPARH